MTLEPLTPLNHKRKRGASLIEAVIGVVVGGILVASGIALVNVSLKAGLQNKYIQSASFLGTDLMERVTSYAQKKWLCDTPTSGCGIYNLNKGSTNQYHIVADSAGVFTSGTGAESGFFVDGTAYDRYFYTGNVCRFISGNNGGNISSSFIPPATCPAGEAEDPSTQKVTVVIVWPGGGTIENVKYVTRFGNRVFQQTNWSGGGGQATFPGGIPNDKFDTKTQTTDVSNQGSITVQE